MRKTIKSNTDISTVFSHGKRYSVSGMTLIVLKTQEHGPSGRVAFIAGKKNGNAVWRNAAKRRMRALCSELQGPWSGLDIIFLAKRSVLNIPYQKQLSEGQRAIISITRNAAEPLRS
ncbi:ribonuclease P protein component [Anaerotardibacter muris]|uniref:ribonuclease P protein component n=1 Tax=Anaerotardibacter muris TaxID=2941505 RepID=UPI00203E7310|nr:ribonuclease P protein component [Anaerotardibacter muris]